jgi:hypothetical protein
VAGGRGAGPEEVEPSGEERAHSEKKDGRVRRTTCGEDEARGR